MAVGEAFSDSGKYRRIPRKVLQRISPMFWVFETGSGRIHGRVRKSFPERTMDNLQMLLLNLIQGHKVPFSV